MNFTDINIIGQIADLKDTDYKNTLAITALIELFIEKGFFTREDFISQAQALEKSTVAEITAQRCQQGLSVIKNKG